MPEGLVTIILKIDASSYMEGLRRIFLELRDLASPFENKRKAWRKANA